MLPCYGLILCQYFCNLKSLQSTLTMFVMLNPGNVTKMNYLHRTSDGDETAAIAPKLYIRLSSNASSKSMTLSQYQYCVHPLDRCPNVPTLRLKWRKLCRFIAWWNFSTAFLLWITWVIPARLLHGWLAEYYELLGIPQKADSKFRHQNLAPMEKQDFIDHREL